MHACPECGKTMATAGGLEIHIQLAHEPEPPPPAAVPEGELIPVEEAAPPGRAARPGARSSLRMPDALRRFDSTVPLTGLMIVLLFLGGVAAALNGGGSATAIVTNGGADTATTGPEAEPSTPIDPTVDQRLATSLVLDPNDLPDGWKTTPHHDDPADAEARRMQAACLGQPDPVTIRSANAAGVDASSSDERYQVQSEVALARTAKEAHEGLSALLAPNAIPCAKAWITRSLAAQGIRVVHIGAGQFAANTANVRSVAFHFEIAAEKNGQTGTLFADEVDMQKGRIEAQVAFLSFGGSFPPEDEQTVTTRFAHKIAYA
ncbi:MAG: hypothetical protein JWP02_3570 [Acidimicrobiales bacterium]|nr:hypothetical protein [Acidimicrobiales bacterium]